MSFPRYDEYKDSGVEWLGEVPAHWEIARFDTKTATHKNTVAADSLTGRSVLHYSIPSVQEIGHGSEEDGSEIDSNKLIIDEKQLLVSKLNPHKNTKIIAEPDIALLTVASTEFVPLIPLNGCDINYIFYVWSSATCITRLISLCDSATRSHQRVAPTDITRHKWAWPTLPEQTAIASFLDRETAKIDDLVAEQQNLIALLKEKRQALISHAVTKGLNPNAPMKDSGVEWLGEVPAHWETQAVWMLFRLGRGRVISHEEIASNLGEYPVYSSQTENDGKMGEINTFDFEGDYLTWTTDGANAGTVFRRSGRFNCTNVCGTLKPKAKETRLDYFVHSVGISTAYFVRHDINPKLMNNVMGKIRIPCPPESEQVAIAAFLDRETAKIDDLVAQAESTITLLQERRTALISAAVTGKIDVRGCVQSSAAKEYA